MLKNPSDGAVYSQNGRKTQHTGARACARAAAAKPRHLFCPWDSLSLSSRIQERRPCTSWGNPHRPFAVESSDTRARRKTSPPNKAFETSPHHQTAITDKQKEKQENRKHFSLGTQSPADPGPATLTNTSGPFVHAFHVKEKFVWTLPFYQLANKKSRGLPALKQPQAPFCCRARHSVERRRRKKTKKTR